MKTPESRVKDAVNQILKNHSVWFFKPVSNGMGVHGIGDYVCCFNGHFVMIECKGRDELKPTALQLVQAGRIQKAGGTWMLVTPSTLNALENWLTYMEAE